VRIREVTDPEEWNRYLAGFRHASSLQTWGWGEVKRASGWRVRRWLVGPENRPLLAAQVLTRGRGPLAISYVPRGPAFDDLEALVEGLPALRAAASGGYLKIEPPLALPADREPPRLGGAVPAETIQPEYSIQVLLDDEEAMLGRMKPKTRYNIRLSGRKGATGRIVHPTDPDAEEAFAAFFALFTATNRRARLLQHSRDYYRRVFSAMHGRGSEAFLSLAELDGEPLAAGLFVAFKDRVDYLYGGSTRAHRQVMAPYRMHWTAMLHGRATGRRYYDLWGVPRVLSPESHAYGIYRFKEGFGGERVRFPAYDLPRSWLYRPLTRALRLRKDLVNWRVRGSRRDVL